AGSALSACASGDNASSTAAARLDRIGFMTPLVLGMTKQPRGAGRCEARARSGGVHLYLRTVPRPCAVRNTPPRTCSHRPERAVNFLICLGALVFLMYVAYRGHSVILFAPIAAMLAVLLTDPAAVPPMFT